MQRLRMQANPIIYLASVAAALHMTVACSSFGKIQVRHDEFKNASIVTLKLQHSSEESIDLLGILSYPSIFEYIREIGSDGETPLRIKISIRGSTETPALEPNVFIKTDAATHEIALLDRDSVLTSASTAQSHVTHYHKPNASGAVDFTKPDSVQSKTQTGNYSYRDLIAEIVLTAGQQQDLLKTNSLSLRFYAGTNPVTFRISPDDLQKIQTLIRTKPTKVSSETE
jgi:hypothetical protein